MDDRDAQARIDAALIDRVRREIDPEVFGLLVRRHQGLVRAQLRRLLPGDPATADELAQDTFVLAWRKLRQFRGDARFSTWLYRIAHSCFLQHLREKKRDGVPQPLEAGSHELDTPLVGTDNPEMRLDVAAALQQLPMHQRAALLYCVQMGLSHEEAAVVLDMPLGSVKTNVTRGKARLRELLQDWALDNEKDDFQ